MNLFQKILDFLLFRAKANNRHGIHSPFVYELYGEVLNTSKNYYCFGPIESLRAAYLIHKGRIPNIDYGAGAAESRSNEIAISTIANKSLQKPQSAALLFKMIDFFQSKTIIELGTSLGITTCYLAMANKKANVYSIEGNPHISAIAESCIKRLNIKNAKLLVGKIEDRLPELLTTLPTVDFVLFDANHQYKPTMAYFEQCLRKSNEFSVFVFDDIYWSNEMKAAWQAIIKHPAVTLSIDCYDFGLIFFRKGRAKEHFMLKIN